MDFTLNKREFKDAIHLRYDWQISDTPSTCACGDVFYVDHAMICRRGGFIIQRHNELRDLEAEMLKMVCNDNQIEPVLQEINGEVLTPGTNSGAADTRLDISSCSWASGSGKALPFFMLGSVTQMQSRIEASPQNKSTTSKRVRRRECTPAKC